MGQAFGPLGRRRPGLPDDRRRKAMATRRNVGPPYGRGLRRPSDPKQPSFYLVFWLSAGYFLGRVKYQYFGYFHFQSQASF